MTAPKYTAFGKQVLRNGEDFAQASSAEAAILIVVALGGRAPGSLERDALALRLRHEAVGLSTIAAQVSDPVKGQLCRAFNAMNQAAEELSNGR